MIPPKLFTAGEPIHHFTVICRADNSECGMARWLVRCVCGAQKVVRGQRLRSGATTSCGCKTVRKGRPRRAVRIDKPQDPIYHAWRDMISRCYRPRATDFKNYGGRGITVCDRWRYSYAAFAEDMGAKPTPKHTLDRINNDGSYCPENCRWATMTEQRRNTRKTSRFTIKGETITLAGWAERVGLSSRIVCGRLRNGWDITRALSQPCIPRTKVRAS